MLIPKTFKIGMITFKVKLVDKIEFNDAEFSFLKTKKINSGSFIFGCCDCVSQTIYLAIKDLDGNEISKERLESTFYHELAHALVGETADADGNSNEIFIESLGKNMHNYMLSKSEEPAEFEKEVEDTK